MAHVLVIYSTTHGHTGKIADEIASGLRAAGARADSIPVEDVTEADLERSDAVVVGASVHGGKHQQRMIDWAREHAEWLNGRPSMFFSVSLSAAEDTEDSQRAVAYYLRDFAAETGWDHPTIARSFAGALQYREYDPFTRLVMRLMMRRGGHPTDASHDFEYTDWEAVKASAAEFADAVAEAGPDQLSSRSR